MDKKSFKLCLPPSGARTIPPSGAPSPVQGSAPHEMRGWRTKGGQRRKENAEGRAGQIGDEVEEEEGGSERERKTGEGVSSAVDVENIKKLMEVNACVRVCVFLNSESSLLCKEVHAWMPPFVFI